jgi:hypothetical protein
VFDNIEVLAPVQFLPHEIGDLQPTLDYMRCESKRGSAYQNWHLRYVLLLWLSLICRIPFDLALFDDETKHSTTAQTLVATGEQWLYKAGLERFAAATLLARVYMRCAVHTHSDRDSDQGETERICRPNSTPFSTMPGLVSVMVQTPLE